MSICAVIGIADELESRCRWSIVYLKEVMGVDVGMVTGDNRTANAISRQLNLSPDRVISSPSSCQSAASSQLQAEVASWLWLGTG
jgi:cation transport ATPase